jgi:Zn-dependent M28 family amino/carboxypeptidase
VDDAGNVVVGDPSRARILVGAHYDSISGTPGADDNASGVAALITAARAVGPREEVSVVPNLGCSHRAPQSLIVSKVGT